MTADLWIASGIAGITGAVMSALLVGNRLKSTPPPELLRINVSNKEIPVVLGLPVVLGAIGGLAAATTALAAMGDRVPWRLGIASLVVLLALWLAGSWDDRRGDERPRGFAGHLGAARGLHLTGGIVKLLVGSAAGLVAGAVLTHGRAVIEFALMIALTANLINLLDRAPGRAGKVALVGLLPLAIFGASAWTPVAGAGLIGALLLVLPADLGERAMLGDSGANPIGGILGLGLAVSLPEAWLVVSIIILLGLNLASERWSFSETIARVRVLNAFDRIGRTQQSK